ncbi:type II secretion system F family protein [Clostridium swellfunianum]|uniref:type II secretion system F family protein n=1 Tax=Clostridium swellfunianum TaxID=1367462 RepID=UPI00202E69A1|nr:type II secretion system F family protein [Clostridium swellfunianum]MCM0650759.1 type II secretion system F family protein [Clostridium swellfunianum]
MPSYQYEARNLQGNIIKGKMEAESEDIVRTSLRERDYYPQNIKLYSSSMDIDLSKYKKISTQQIAIFCRQFSFTISAGMNILRAMDVVAEQTENKKFRNILKEVKSDIEKGSSLSEALGKHEDIPEMLVNMISVGEMSGTLDTVMNRMADYYEKSYKLQKKIKGSLTYPIMVAVVAVVVVNLLLIFVLPTFVGMITSSGGTLPMPTRIIMALSDFMKKYGLLLMGFILMLAIVAKIFIRNNEEAAEKVDMLKLDMPLFGKIITKIVTARFTRTFGTLMSTGVPLLESIDICSKVVGNAVASKLLQSTSEAVRKGHSIALSLEGRGVFPTMLTQMMKIGEETGTLDSIMEKTAEFYDNEVENATSQLSTLIEPLIIVFLAVVVGFIVIAMLLPMFEMYNLVSSM